MDNMKTYTSDKGFVVQLSGKAPEGYTLMSENDLKTFEKKGEKIMEDISAESQKASKEDYDDLVEAGIPERLAKKYSGYAGKK